MKTLFKIGFLTLALFTNVTALAQNSVTELFACPKFKLLDISVHQGAIKTRMIVVVLQPELSKAKVFGQTKDYPYGRSSEGIMNNEGVQVILGSGFVKKFFPLDPRGWLKIEGEVLSGMEKDGFNGIIGVKKSKLELMHFKDKSLSFLDEGFQSGPMIVRDKMVLANVRNSVSKATRAFVGLNTRRQIIMAITLQPVSLKDLSIVLTDPQNLEVLKCVNCINLAGDGSESLMVKTDKRTFEFGNTTTDMSAFITFY